MKKKKIIFDLDDTLLFLSSDGSNNYDNLIGKHQLPFTFMELFSIIGEFEKNSCNHIISKDKFINYINERLPINITEKVFEELLNGYVNIPLLDIDKVYSVLDYLSKKYELIAYTNWFTDNQIKRLKKYNLDHFFTKVYGWDLLPTKPSKKGLESIIGDSDIKDYTFIGDSIKCDLEIPNQLGMNTIFLNRKKIEQTEYKEIFNLDELKRIL